MVAMAIGLVVVGAVMTNYLNNTSATRRTNALAQVSSDASLAMGILRNHIAVAGFAQPTGVDATGKMLLTPIGQGIVGCAGSAMTATVTTSNSPAAWSCDATVTPSDSFLVRYQTDASVSPLTKTGNVPMDCLGNDITPVSPNTTYIAENNFYVAPDSNGLPTLYCRTVNMAKSTVNSGGPLVENITELHLTFGVAASADKTQPIVKYVTAAQVGSLPDTLGAWDAVKAVRICLVVRSAEAVLPVSDTSTSSYIGCDKAVHTPTDRFIYRAFTTTVVLNNRLTTL